MNPHVDREVIDAEKGLIGAEAFRQEYGGEFLGVDLGPCETCGGPREDAPGEVTAPEGQSDDSFIPECPGCGMFVGEDGRCIVKKHNDGFAEFDVDRPWADSCTWYSWHCWGPDRDWHQG